MATCKECIHYNACNKLSTVLGLPTTDMLGYEKYCGCFADKSRYIELPCKVGDVVYSLAYQRGGFALLKGKAERFAFNQDNRLCIDIAFENGFVWRYHPENFGKTLFLTPEEAEAKMKGGAE